ncbi:hypothetical protein F5Y10DRAFT_64997 [Nemania abortiva]|nr:hypothetical protein F5Y10DRAFT_64997 [Nemania abortiva]
MTLVRLRDFFFLTGSLSASYLSRAYVMGGQQPNVAVHAHAHSTGGPAPEPSSSLSNLTSIMTSYLAIARAFRTNVIVLRVGSFISRLYRRRLRGWSAPLSRENMLNGKQACKRPFKARSNVVADV